MGPLARQEERAAYLFLLPWLIGSAVFTVGPIVASVCISLTDWNLMNPPRWVGTENYEKMLADRNFYQSMRVTLSYVALSVPLYLVLGLALALLLNQRLRGMYVFRTILFLPSVIAGMAVAVLWSILLNPDPGVVNQILRAIGISDPPRWLASPDWAVPSVVLMGLWGIGGGAIIYLAGLQNIPAALRGGGDRRRQPVQKFWDITLPDADADALLRADHQPDGAFQVFDIAFVLAAAGLAAPARSSSTCSISRTRASARPRSATPRRWRGCWSSWPPSPS